MSPRDRLNRPALLYRGLDFVQKVFDVRGGGGSPTELRSDAGVFMGYDLNDLLAREREIQFVSHVRFVMTINAALTSQTTNFDIGQVANQSPDVNREFYLLGIEFLNVSGFAPITNWESGIFMLNNANSVDRMCLFRFEAADLVGPLTTAIAVDTISTDGWLDEPKIPKIFPLYCPPGTTFTATMRTGAGGQARGVINMIFSTTLVPGTRFMK